MSTDDFVEERGAAALSVSSSSQAPGVFTFGTRIERQLCKPGEVNVVLTGSVGWRYAVGNVDPVTAMRPDGSSAVTVAVTGVPVDQNTALFQADLRHMPWTASS